MNNEKSKKQQIFMMTADDLAEHTREIVRETVEMLMSDHKTQPHEKEHSEVMTVRETVDYLHVSKTLLWQLENAGKLKPFRIGRRVLYRRADVLAISEEGSKHE